jgi:hypothetical protein
LKISALEATYGRQFVRVTGQSAIEAQLLNAVQEREGLFLGHAGGTGRACFNGVDQGGVVRFLDGQTGTVAWFQGFKDLYFLPTWP